ncbi:mastermind-like protein 3 isoform X2 [Spea bombifrons]|uniref:mastermind-like protein 3 isoform X2 n=1 Tax=Spea bombifrons TaxID=233779 RepID=UPI00234BCEDB|nr:mastermind-like protein 3 isoform X2 [Spea bombifrons]
MGDFAAPAASSNGSSSLCISTALGSSIGGAGTGIGVGSHSSSNNTPPSAAAAPNALNNSSAGIPKHSTVVERLRQRIEGCRRHHVSCESRYQQAQAEQLEMERRDTVNLYQRSLEQRAKKSGASQGGASAGAASAAAGSTAGGAGGNGKQHHHHHHQNHHQGKQQDAEAAASGTAEQRSHTLIMLQEAVQRKLEGARSPLNGEQQNGVCDGRFSPSAKRRRKELPAVEPLSNMPLPSVSPLHQIDIKPHLPVPNSATHSSGLEDVNKNGGQQDMKLALNGSGELEESFSILQNKDMKQEPLDDASVMDSSETSLSNQNKLFSDINLNDQEWQELIDELANTVPEDDIEDLFNEGFEEKKELDFPRPTAQTPLPQESASVKSDPSHSPFPHVSMGSPQVRPSSSGPSFSNVSSVSSVPSVSSAPSTLMMAGSPASCVVQSPQTPTQPHTPGQTSTRPGNGYTANPASNSGSGTVNLPSADLSPAEQLKQMAAQQQHRAKLIQQKQQHQQQHTNHPSNWSPVGPPSSPYGGTFGPEKPNSPMMYPQVYNNQNPIVPPMANNPPKSNMNNYLPQSHMNMISQQTNSMGANAISKPPNMLSYGNTKPLTHFNVEMSQRMTPPVVNQNKNTMMPYMQQPQQQQPPIPPQMSHLSEEQKRLLIMKQKGLMNQSMAYPSLPSHSQEQNAVGMSRPAGPMQQSVPGAGANPGGPAFMPSQPQAAMMKQMLIEQRAQLHAIEQQKQQFLREQRQQQQQILAEQMQQPHLNRQHLQQQRNPYGVQQVNQFQGSPQDIAAARSQAALQNMRTSRMMAQNAGMMSMGPSQNPGTMTTAAMQPEMGMAPYSNTSNSQPAMYSMNTGVNQMMQHPNQNSMNMAHGTVQGTRQPASSQGLGMVGGFGQNMLVNSVMSQQHQQMKGPVGQTLTRPQAPRLQNMMTSLPQGSQNWTQRGIQGMSVRTSGEMGYNNGAVYPMQGGQPRMPKQHFQQGLSQSVVDGTGTVRAVNPAMSRQMMQSLPGQQGNNQSRQMMPGMNPGIPNMASFNQAPTQQMPVGNFPQNNQGQGYDRNHSQDMSYGYTDASASSFPGIADGADLVDSIMSRGPGDEWMQELDELFGNP